MGKLSQRYQEKAFLRDLASQRVNVQIFVSPMKVFFKNLLTSFLGTFLALVALGIFSMIFFAGVIFSLFSGDDKPWIPEDSVLVIDLSVNVVDAPIPFDMDEIVGALMGGSSAPNYSLRSVLSAIDEAASDDRISAILLRGNFQPDLYGSGYPVVGEIRSALKDFRDNSGKPIHAFLEVPTLRDYYIASVADSITLDPSGIFPFPGMAMESLYLTELLEKIGVEMQIIRAGEFKSATEIFTETEMSAENREQMERLLQDYWQYILQTTANSRGQDPADWEALSQNTPVLRGEDSIHAGFVDASGFYEEALERLARDLGKLENDLSRVGFSSYLEELEIRDRESKTRHRQKIAIGYLEGDLFRGARSGPGQVDIEKLVAAMRSFREDPEVKAFVLRINSPGGDVLTSDLIRRELALIREQMPVIVSFGTYATSGGYWAAMGSDKIFADPMTLTGSIGAFGVLPNVEEMRGKIGLGHDFVRTGEFATMLSPFRRKDPAEIEVWQGFIDDSYEEFLRLVGDGRGLSREQVEPLAGGRIWSGQAARDNGLVDAYGGLQSAIEEAAGMAGLETFGIIEYPRPVTFGDFLQEALRGPEPLVKARTTPFPEEVEREIRYFIESYRPFVVQARLPVPFRIP